MDAFGLGPAIAPDTVDMATVIACAMLYGGLIHTVTTYGVPGL
jgi:hypothetical protein